MPVSTVALSTGEFFPQGNARQNEFTARSRRSLDFIEPDALLTTAVDAPVPVPVDPLADGTIWQKDRPSPTSTQYAHSGEPYDAAHCTIGITDWCAEGLADTPGLRSRISRYTKSTNPQKHQMRSGNNRHLLLGDVTLYRSN